MCGFISLHTSSEGINNYKPVVKAMLNKLIHRGPDDEGMHSVDGQAIFGHRRLAIIDLEHGKQPMVSECGRYTLVFNGEIYNYIELREELVKSGKVHFKTKSDTEVLLNILIEHGANALSKINGMFSFVLHDKKENNWLAARDHFGIKPLYYVEVENQVVFSSEIKALLKHPAVKVYRDDHALQQYLAFQFCLEDRTLFENIKKVKPGHYLTGKGGKLTSDVCYWSTNYEVDHDHTYDYFSRELLSLLQDSISLQSRADVPVGGYLSGGIDSSLICSIAGVRNNESFNVFHGKFLEGLEYDESFYAKELAKSCGSLYREVIPTAEDFVNSMPGLIYALDEPVAGPGLFPQYVVSRLAKEHVTVVLGGQGGDEIFGGYARYLIAYLEQALKGAIFENQEEGRHLVTLESIVPNLSLLKQYTPLLSHFWSRGLFDSMDARYFHLIDRSQGIESLLEPDLLTTFDRKQLYTDFQGVFNHPDTLSYINKMTHFDQKTLLPALLQVEDRVSMAVSLESRVPFLDRRIVDLVTRMPPQLKFAGGQTKNVLKKIAKGYLPKTVLHRKDKMGFPVPLKDWLKGGVAKDFVFDTLLSEKSKSRGIYKKEALSGFLDNQGVGGRQLWGALSLELWHNQFIDA